MHAQELQRCMNITEQLCMLPFGRARRRAETGHIHLLILPAMVLDCCTIPSRFHYRISSRR